MHIIALEHEPSSARGGQELNLFEICRGLSQRGHNISLLYETEGNLIEEYRHFCNSIIKVNSYGFNRRRLTSLFNFLTSIPAIWKVPITEDVVIFSNDYYSVFFGLILAFFKKVSFVCYLQLPPCLLNYQRRIGLKGVKRFIAVSNQTKFDWVKLGIKEDKIDVVYNGTNLEVLKPLASFSTLRKEWNIPENIRVILYVGRLDRMKGLETLLRAFALFVKNGASARLLIAGKPVEEGDEYKKSLEELSSDLDIENYVSFLGYVANTIPLYQVSDVTVLPSQWSEPFGRVIVESMACGTPVVASRIGGIPEILTGEFQRGLFEPGNERDLLDKLNQMLNWRDRDSQLSKKCWEHVLSKFSIDRMVDGIEKVLLNSLQNS